MAGSETATGSVQVLTSGLSFIPDAEVTIDPVSDFSGQRPNVSELEPCATLNQDPCEDGTLDTVTIFNQV